jgi:hypothetical protein
MWRPPRNAGSETCVGVGANVWWLRQQAPRLGIVRRGRAPDLEPARRRRLTCAGRPEREPVADLCGSPGYPAF